ncbi:MAG: hypothetical protein PF489_03730 [Salinivirgaceae bacterium]|jgi:hypothetical protein|nr:hypothetical protein [Salinivirgaceae bacterium]
MLSICITNTNSNITTLLNRLHEQRQMLDLKTEINIADSCSETLIKKDNELAANHVGANYFFTDENLSHGQLKAILGEKSSGSYLLFINGSMHITQRKYLQNYIEVMQPGLIVCGGITAIGKRPEPEFQLHWYAKHNFYSYHADDRSQYPYFHLDTNNLLIPRGLFLQFPVPEIDEPKWMLPYYFELKDNTIPIIHIDNPLSIHTFLTNKRFLAHNRKHIKQITQWLNKINDEIVAHTSITEYEHYKKLRKWKLAKLYQFFYSVNTRILMSSLGKDKPKKTRLYKGFRRWTFMKTFKKD